MGATLDRDNKEDYLITREQTAFLDRSFFISFYLPVVLKEGGVNGLCAVIHDNPPEANATYCYVTRRFHGYTIWQV